MRTMVVGLACWTLLATVPVSADPPYEKTRIPHRDGSGRATLVEIDPEVPGARDFVRAEERPAPGRGELDLPTPTPVATASVAPSPARRY